MESACECVVAFCEVVLLPLVSWRPQEQNMWPTPPPGGYFVLEQDRVARCGGEPADSITPFNDHHKQHVSHMTGSVLCASVSSPPTANRPAGIGS